MNKLLLIVLLSVTFFGLGNCTFYIWNQTVTNGYWSAGSSWLNGTVPGSGDCAYIPSGVNVIFNVSTAQTSIMNVTFAGASFYITGPGNFITSGDFNFVGSSAMTLRIDGGASLSVGGHFQVTNPQLCLFILGSAQAAGLRASSSPAGGLVSKGISPVMITGGTINIIDNSFTVTQNTFVFSNVQQNFGTILATSAPTLTFNYLPIIATLSVSNQYFNPIPVNFVFTSGATFTSLSALITNNATGLKPTVNFQSGTYSGLSGSVSFDAAPSFSGTSIVINTGTLTFSNQAVSFTGSPLVLSGTGGLSFSDNSGSQTASITGTLNVYLNTFSFTSSAQPNMWTFSGTALNFYVPYAITAIYNFGLPVTFYQPASLAPSGGQSSPVGIRGTAPTFYNSLTNNANSQTFNFQPVFNCTAGTFTLGGSGNLALLGGISIGGCNVVVTGSLTTAINGAIQVTGNSTIDVSMTPLNTTTYQNIAFSAPAIPNSLYSLTIKSQISISLNVTLTATQVNVIFQSAATNFPFGTQFQGNGQFDFPGSINVNDFWVVGPSTTIALPSGVVNFNKQGTNGVAVQFQGSLLLRNTQITGNQPFCFTGPNITILNGISQISTPSFLINSNLVLAYLANGTTGYFYENPTLIFNSGSPRVWFHNLILQPKVSVIFDENLIFNCSLNFNATNTNTSIVFRQATTIQSVGVISNNYVFNGFFLFNGTSFRMTGPGAFRLLNNFLIQGNLNYPFTNIDATIFIGGQTVLVYANSFFGPTVIATSAFNTDDGDGNPATAYNTLTLQGLSGLAQVLVGGTFNIGTNLTFTNSILAMTSPTTFSGQTGYVIFQGTCFTLQTNLIFNIRTVLPSPANFNTTSSAFTATVTFNPAINNNQADGVWIPGALNIFTGVTINFKSSGTPPLNVYFLTGSTVGGAGTLMNGNSANFIATTAPVTFTTSTEIFSQVIFSGPSTFTLSPANTLLQLSSLINASTTVTYTQASVQLNAGTTITNNFLFSAPTVNFTASSGNSLVFIGNRVQGNTFYFNNVPNVYFNNSVTFTTSTPFTNLNPTTINFYFDLILTTGVSVTIPQNVTFGLVQTFSSLTIGGAGQSLTLTGRMVTVNGNINVQPGSLVILNFPGPGLQQFSGNSAQLPNTWSYTSAVCFIGNFNFTGSMNISNAHNLNGNIYFTQGVLFSTGGSFNGSSTANIFAQYFLTVASTTGLTINSLTTYGTSPFSINGTGSLSVNGTYSCSQAVTFSIPVTFGYSSMGSGNVILGANCQWYGSVQVTLYVNSFSVATNPSAIYPSLNFACTNSSTISVIGGTSLFLYGNVTFNTPQAISFSGTNFGQITVTSNFNTTATGISPISLVTFQSGPGAVEPIISFFGSLVQPILLLSPTVLKNVNLGQFSSVTSQLNGRADFQDSLSISSTVFISQPYTFFLSTNTSASQFALSLSSPSSTFTVSPQAYNPYGFGPPSISFTVSSVSSTIKFVPNTTYGFNNLIVNSAGTVRISTGSINVAGTIQVNPTSTLWIDLATVVAQNITLVPPPTLGATPSYLKYSVASATPPAISTTYAVYGGGLVVFLSNFNPTSTVTINNFITATVATGNTLSPVGGSPGFSYFETRSNANLNLVITPNGAPIPFPTQSNGPAPPVSVATTQFFSVVVLFISLCFAMLAL